jgi:glycosyltransferase involved in cell wall biosynthesis
MQKILKVKDEKFFVLEHPKYNAVTLNKQDALILLRSRYTQYISQKHLKFKKIYLFFGQVSVYKGILELAQHWNQIADENSLLLIAGMTKKGEEEYARLLDKEVKEQKNIIWINQFIPDNDTPILFNSCDSVIFNYQDILTSGGVILAQSYDKAIIAPKLGCIQELEGNSSVTLFKNIKELQL